MNGTDITALLMYDVKFRPREEGVECLASQHLKTSCGGSIHLHHTIYAANIEAALTILKKRAKVILPLHRPSGEAP